MSFVYAFQRQHTSITGMEDRINADPIDCPQGRGKSRPVAVHVSYDGDLRLRSFHHWQAFFQ
jgi:hypothetical protein